MFDGMGPFFYLLLGFQVTRNPKQALTLYIPFYASIRKVSAIHGGSDLVLPGGPEARFHSSTLYPTRIICRLYSHTPYQAPVYYRPTGTLVTSEFPKGPVDQSPYELQSKLLVSPLISLIILPCIVPHITPL